MLGNYTKIPNDLLRGGHGIANIAVLCAALSHGKCWASAETLAKEVGCKRHTVFKALSYWVKFGYLEKIARNGKTSVYNFVHTSAQSGTGGVPKWARVPVPERAHEEEQYKNNKEEGANFSLKGKGMPYIEGERARKNFYDSSIWEVRNRDGRWVEYVGSIKDNLEYR